MAEAESAHTITAPALSSCASATYRDLNKSDGSIDLRALMTLARRRARQERADYQRLGMADSGASASQRPLNARGKSPRISAMPSLPLARPPSQSTPQSPCAANSNCSPTARTTAPPKGETSNPNWCGSPSEPCHDPGRNPATGPSGLHR
jgi:hypothetical protein